MLKLLTAAALAVTPSSVAPATVAAPDSAIVRVICPGLLGYSAGTAFRIGPTGIMLSVNHVTKPGTCRVAGSAIKVSYASPSSDFSMVDGAAGPYLKVDCGGFIKGRRYVAIGYARGLPTLTSVNLLGTGETMDGAAVLIGVFTVIPGMSGGPVLDAETGKVVGTVNFYNMERGLSGSVELKNTPVCKKGGIA